MFRQVNTKTWADAWFNSLGVVEKLMYLYLFTNAHASVSGLFELPVRVIWFETGIDEEKVSVILRQFQDANKLAYDFDAQVIWIYNMFKFQGSQSPKLRNRVNQDLRDVPRCKVSEEFYKRYHLAWGRPNVDLEALSLGGNWEAPAPQPTPDPDNDTDLGKAVTLFENEIGPITPMLGDTIKDLVDTYTYSWFEQAVHIAVKAGARKMAYIEAVLSNMKSGGRDGKPAKITNAQVATIIEELANE